MNFATIKNRKIYFKNRNIEWKREYGRTILLQLIEYARIIVYICRMNEESTFSVEGSLSVEKRWAFENCEGVQDKEVDLPVWEGEEPSGSTGSDVNRGGCTLRGSIECETPL